MKPVNRNQSLQHLDGQDWGEPNFDSHLVRECHRLCHVPLKDFTLEDLRIMLGQDIGTKYLFPIALEHLEQNPLAEALNYQGDLLVGILNIGPRFWQMYPKWKADIERLALQAISMAKLLPERFQVTSKALEEAYNRFSNANNLQIE